MNLVLCLSIFQADRCSLCLYGSRQKESGVIGYYTHMHYLAGFFSVLIISVLYNRQDGSQI